MDLAVLNGTVVDGTGAAPFVADVGIRDGRIVEVGAVGDARRSIDASGLVVAPGFIDIHTHYDAQILWDPDVTPSSLHGVTTVIGGNCGFTLAPAPPHAREYLTTMLARVEGMPLEALRAGIDFSWESFGEYLEHIGGSFAVNAGFLMGHSAIRYAVMGADAVGKEATAEQIEEMARLLGDGVRAGALGFSSSWATTHNDADGQPVPSRWATADELVALATELRNHEGTVLEFLPGGFGAERLELMTRMSLAAGRPLNWNLLSVDADRMDVVDEQLAASDHAAARGATVVALTLPDLSPLRLSFETGFLLETLPGWADLFRLPPARRLEALGDPRRREELARGARQVPARMSHIADFPGFVILETHAPANADVVGRRIRDIAAERGVTALDALLDIVIADELRTGMISPALGDDDESWRLRAQLWRDHRTVLGGTDAGAHLDLLATFGSTSAMLAVGVRERGLVSLEEAVQQLTDVPARLYGLRDRGRIAIGAHADVIVFDPDRIAARPTETRADLPGGAKRLYGEADGVAHVFVAGVETVAGGQLTGARPGTLLRSGSDTDTVHIPATAPA